MYKETLASAINYLSKYNINFIFRITMPVIPVTLIDDCEFIDNYIACYRNADELLQYAKNITRTNSKINIIRSTNSYLNNSFRKCYAMFDGLIIRYDGSVFPCCYTTNKSKYALGKIPDDNIQKLLVERNNMFYTLQPSKECPLCSRKDYLINSIGNNTMPTLNN